MDGVGFRRRYRPGRPGGVVGQPTLPVTAIAELFSSTILSLLVRGEKRSQRPGRRRRRRHVLLLPRTATITSTTILTMSSWSNKYKVPLMRTS